MSATRQSSETTRVPELIFSEAKLLEMAEQNRTAYQNAEPFPHIVIDDFMSSAVLDAVLAEFPGAKSIEWEGYNDEQQRKLGQKTEDEIGTYTRFLLYQFNSAPFIHFLENLTGIEGLVPDPHFWGGGLHQIEPDGFLKLHTDFNFHPVLKLDRRINVLVYLNRDWEESYGGHLQLWDKDITECKQRIAPVFNRCVIFNTTDYSYHGHPEPIACPAGQTRKSIALYYYSNGRPANETKRTAWTNWQMTPEERSRGRFKRAVSRLIPPIFFDLKHTIAKALSRRSDDKFN